MSSSAENKTPPPRQGEVSPADKVLLKGCLYSFLKFLGLLAAFLGLLFLLVDNYDRGCKAFEKGFWESAVFFLENVKPSDEHYKDAREKLRIAREKIKQQQQEERD